MSFSCTSCLKEFRSGAALNFHAKKAHAGDNLPVQGFPNRDEREMNTVDLNRRQSKRKRPAMVRFGRLQGVPDYTKGSFKVSQITSRIAEDNKKDNRKDSSNDDLSSTGTQENLLILPRPKTSPSMPVLSPQSLSVNEAVANVSGPKKNKKRKLEFSDNLGSTLPAVPEATSKDISSQVDDARSSTSKSQCSTSRTSDAGSNVTGDVLETDVEKRLSDDSNNGECGTRQTRQSVKTRNSPSQVNDQQRRKISKRPTSLTYQCPLCQKTGFRNHGHYVNHLEIHEGLRPFLCPIPDCGMGYETDLKLLEHVSIRHSQEAKFTCPNCSVDYKTHRGLENHRCC